MQFGVTVGIKGLQALVGTLPSWLSFSDSDKMDWFNEVVNELWPFVDKGVCRLIKETVTPIINNQIRTYKVPINQVTFKQVG